MRGVATFLKKFFDVDKNLMAQSLGQPEPRVLGRNHLRINAPKEADEPDLKAATGALSSAMAFDTRDYARQTVALHAGVAKSDAEKLRSANTSFCPTGPLDAAGDALEGELGFAACRVLMKAL